jgi:hypothetical protein
MNRCEVLLPHQRNLHKLLPLLWPLSGERVHFRLTHLYAADQVPLV